MQWLDPDGYHYRLETNIEIEEGTYSFWSHDDQCVRDILKAVDKYAEEKESAREHIKGFAIAEGLDIQSLFADPN